MASYVDRNKKSWAVSGAPPSLRAVGDYAGSPVLTGATQADLAVQIEAYAFNHPPAAPPTSSQKGGMLVALAALGVAGVLWGLSRK